MALAFGACCAAGVSGNAATAQAANGTGTPFELAYWQAVAGSNDPALYDAYLQQFPDGTFAAIAHARTRDAHKAAVPLALVRPAMPLAPMSAPLATASAPIAAIPTAVASPGSALIPATATTPVDSTAQSGASTTLAGAGAIAEPSKPQTSGPHLPLGTPLSLLATAATAASVASAAQTAAASALTPNIGPSVTLPPSDPVLATPLPDATTLASADPEPVIANAALVSALGSQSSAVTGAAMGTGGNLAASTPTATSPGEARQVLAAAQPVPTPQPWPSIVPPVGPSPLVLAADTPSDVQPGAAVLRAASAAQDAAAAQVTPKAQPRPSPAPKAAPPRMFRAIERSRPRRAPVIVAAAYAPRRVLTTAATSPAMQDVGLMGGGGISPLGTMLTQLAYSQQTPGAGLGMAEEASLPMRPAFMPVPPVQVPSAFCSIDQRNAFQEGIYEPALAIAQHNNEMAVAYITHLKSLYESYQLSGDTRTIASITAEARDFQPTAALAFSTRDNLVRAFEDLMTTPVSTCGAIQ